MFFNTYSYNNWFIDYEVRFLKNRYHLFITQENNAFEKIIFTAKSKELAFNLFTSWFHSIVKKGEVIYLIHRGFPIYIEDNILFSSIDKPFGFAITPSTIKDKSEVLENNRIPSFLKQSGYLLMAQLQNFFLLEPHLVENSKLFAVTFKPRMATLHAQSIRLKDIFSKSPHYQIREEYFSYCTNYMEYTLNPFFDDSIFSKYLLDEVYIPHKDAVLDILYLGEWKNKRFCPSMKFNNFVKPQFKSLVNTLY